MFVVDVVGVVVIVVVAVLSFRSASPMCVSKSINNAYVFIYYSFLKNRSMCLVSDETWWVIQTNFAAFIVLSRCSVLCCLIMFVQLALYFI